MSPRASRSIRQALGLPRLARNMTAQDRQLYRMAKAQYAALPGGPAREVFLDAAGSFRATLEASQRLGAGHHSPSNR